MASLVKMADTLTSAIKSNIAKPFTVIVEGNIGSGKTTFINHFKKYDNVCVLAEPVDLWRNCAGHNLLSYMYQDKARWGFTFQSYVQLTMLKLHTLETTHPVKLMERSIFSARYCFVEKMLRDGILPSPSGSVLNEWFKWVIAKSNVSVDLIIYLRTSPEIVYQRMLARNREEEKSVPLTFLKELHEMHEEWLYTKTSFSCPAPVITLNGDLDKSVIIDEYKKYESHILNKAPVEVRI
ncbi:hypothetical protein ILUMI_23346 [Ignelater luminosus]|uniref:Deoxynucleoside kinase domain-containing protein n=1 Tax=Ignelater luminosus TaxID=2038154 RepID=A0A8K0C8Y8_IGNLU|nr:hypothetical protein ILUMI_23346 [Ignelater luminosus]